MRLRLWARALRFLQRRCGHPSRHVTADLLEGGYLPLMLQWCRLCGAWRFQNEHPERVAGTSPWNEPHPEWWLCG